MTDREISKELRRKWAAFYPKDRIRKSRLKIRYKNERLDKEIDRTAEKLVLLLEIKDEQTS